MYVIHQWSSQLSAEECPSSLGIQLLGPLVEGRALLDSKEALDLQLEETTYFFIAFMAFMAAAAFMAFMAFMAFAISMLPKKAWRVASLAETTFFFIAFMAFTSAAAFMAFMAFMAFATSMLPKKAWRLASLAETTFFFIAFMAFAIFSWRSRCWKNNSLLHPM